MSLYLYSRKDSDTSILHNSWRKSVNYIIYSELCICLINSGNPALSCRNRYRKLNLCLKKLKKINTSG